MYTKQIFRVSVLLALFLVAWTTGALGRKIELTFWFDPHPSRVEPMRKLISEFNASQTLIEVKGEPVVGQVQKAIVAAAGGSPPDVLWCAWYDVGDLAVKNVIINLEEQFLRPENLYEAYRSDFWPVLWETSKYENQIYAIPFDTNNMLMFYNRDITEASGLSVPNEGWTWAEFTEACRKLTNPSKNIWGYTGTASYRHFYDFLCSAGGRFFSPEGDSVVCNSPEGVRALQFLVDLVNKYKVALWPSLAFEQGKAAIEIQGSYRIPYYREMAKFDYWAVPQPRDKRRFSSNGGESLVIFKTTREREKAAWEFVKWMTSTEADAKWSVWAGYLPVRKSSANTELYKAAVKQEPLLRPFIEELSYGGRYASLPGNTEIMSALSSAISAAMSLKTPVKAALDELARNSNEILARYRKQ